MRDNPEDDGPDYWSKMDERARVDYYVVAAAHFRDAHLRK
jgi:hypothetical protein